MREQLALLPEYLTAHLQLSLVALAVAALASIPLGVAVTRRRALEGPVLGLASYRMPLKGLYLCGSGAHPGGGVTGAPGHNAAREIIRDLKRQPPWLRG